MDKATATLTRPKCGAPETDENAEQGLNWGSSLTGFAFDKFNLTLKKNTGAYPLIASAACKICYVPA